MVGFFALHRRHRERLFYWPPITPHSGDGCDCAVAALRGNLASPPSEVARAKTCGRVMHYWLQRCSGASVGNHIHRGPASPAMNLFCIGLSHHTANVAAREQFAGNATAESIARQAGCSEALLLTTGNRSGVFAVFGKRSTTD